jgi:hypothetical protein
MIKGTSQVTKKLTMSKTNFILNNIALKNEKDVAENSHGEFNSLVKSTDVKGQPLTQVCPG